MIKRVCDNMKTKYDKKQNIFFTLLFMISVITCTLTAVSLINKLRSENQNEINNINSHINNNDLELEELRNQLIATNNSISLIENKLSESNTVSLYTNSNTPGTAQYYVPELQFDYSNSLSEFTYLFGYGMANGSACKMLFTINPSINDYTSDYLKTHSLSLKCVTSPDTTSNQSIFTIICSLKYTNLFNLKITGISVYSFDSNSVTTSVINNPNANTFNGFSALYGIK